MENILEVKKLSKKYDGFELKNINIELPKGTVITNIPEEFIQQILGFVAI
jgi:ABC-type phosphate/phosphonate transport system ATPase subunit